MGLVSKTVEVILNGSNCKYYEDLGYKIPRELDNRGRLRIPKGSKILVKVEDLQKSSHVKVDYICDNCKDIFSTTYRDYNLRVKESGETYCQKCAILLFGRQKIQKTKLKNSKSFEQWCIENNRQDVLDRWDYELNNCSPKDICYNSNKKYWFKCNNYLEHKSELKRISNYTKGIEGSIECNQCSSIAQYILDNFPNKEIGEVWDYEKNGDLDPWSIEKGSNKKFWFICQEKEEHGSYEKTGNKFITGQKCQKCTKERENSTYEEKTRIYLQELGHEVRTEYNCSYIPHNPKTNRPLPFDNEIVLRNGKHLIIEVHGSQHYYKISKSNKYLKEGQTPEEYLHQRKLYDRYKRIKCIQVGYEYLEIPYWTFDKNDTYKKLMDNKIKEILDK